MPGTPSALAANHYASGFGRVRDACPSVGSQDSYGKRTVSKGTGRGVSASRTVPPHWSVYTETVSLACSCVWCQRSDYRDTSRDEAVFVFVRLTLLI